MFDETVGECPGMLGVKYQPCTQSVARNLAMSMAQ